MVSVDKAIIARLEKHGKKLEVLVDPNKALDFKAGKEVDFEDLLAIDEIFSDAHKSERVPNEELNKLLKNVVIASTRSLSVTRTVCLTVPLMCVV